MNKKNNKAIEKMISDSDSDEVQVTKVAKKNDKAKRKASGASEGSQSVSLTKQKAKDIKKKPKQAADSDEEEEKPVKKVPSKSGKKKATSDSDSDVPVQKKPVKKEEKKSKKQVDSDSDEDVKKPVANKGKKADSDSESEKPKKVVAKPADSDDEEIEVVPKKGTNGHAKVGGEEDDGETHAELFVKNLSYKITEDALWEHFGTFGTVTNVKMLFNKETGRPTGLAFVGFESRAEAKAALANAGSLDGRDLQCSFSNDKGKAAGRTPQTNNSRGGYGNNNSYNNNDGGFKKPAYSGDAHTIFVGNLGFKTNENTIKKFFERAGNVVGIRIAKNEEGRSKGFCHVDFDSKDAVQSAIAYAGENLDGREVRVDASEPRKNRDGGDRGGFGGGRGGFGGGRGGGRGGFNKSGPPRQTHGYMGGAGKKVKFDSDEE